MTVRSGPQILTLPHGLRNMLVSRYQGGRVMLVDYVSFEAQVARAMTGREPMPDVYAAAASNVFGGSVTRSVAKVAVLGSMFGIGREAMASELGLRGRMLDVAIERLEAFIGIGDVLASARIDGDIVESHFGRKLRLPSHAQHIIINTRIQSTAADAALAGFANLIERFDELRLGIVPLFVMHDGLIIDCPAESLSRAKEAFSAAAEIEGLGSGFPVRIEPFSGS